MGFLYARASEETSRTVVIVVLGAEMEGRLLAEPLHAALPRSRPAPPALPRLVVPCLAPPCPRGFARGMSGFWIRLVYSMICLKSTNQIESKTKILNSQDFNSFDDYTTRRHHA